MRSWFQAVRHNGDDGGSSQTTVQANNPPAFQQPFLQTGLNRAQSTVLDRPLSFFPGSTVTPFSEESRVGLEGQTTRALEGNPLLQASQDYTQGLLTDPRSSPVFDAVVAETRPGIDSAFSAGGRFGSGLHAEALGKGITRGIAPYIEAAASRAPGLAREDYFDIGQLRDVGAARDLKNEENLQDAINRFNFTQNEPTNRLAQYMQLVQGNYGGQSTSSTRASQSVNPFLTGAGLTLGAGQLANSAAGK